MRGMKRRTLAAGCLAWLLWATPAVAQPEWPCAWGDLACLLREGAARMPGQPEDAYLFYEQAAFIAPEHPEVRRGLGEALLRLGATQAAGDLLAATEGDEARSQRWEFALGHSSNRNQMPSLSQLKLTLPGFPTETMRLDQPLRPDAGPVYWLGYTRRQADGLAVQLGANASFDQRLGLAWARLEKSLDAERRWLLRGDYVRRLDDGWQGGAALRYRRPLAAGLLGDAEIGWREESVQGSFRFIEGRLGVYRETPWGGLGLGLQRSIAWGEQPPGGDQWRLNLLWGMQGTWQSLQWSLAAMLRYSRDDQSYHPWLAEGQPRRQRGALLSAQVDYPLGGGVALWGRASFDRQYSNVEFFTTRRDEYLLGLAYAW